MRLDMVSRYTYVTGYAILNIEGLSTIHIDLSSYQSDSCFAGHRDTEGRYLVTSYAYKRFEMKVPSLASSYSRAHRCDLHRHAVSLIDS